MLTMMKWTFLLAISMVLMDSPRAWNIGSKGNITGPSIHTTYFITPNNAPTPVHARGYVGSFVNGVCQYSAVYDLGNDVLQTGDVVAIDAFRLKSIVGGGYGCLSIYYTYKQLVIETFQLQFDGINYTNTNPQNADVMIL